MLLLELGNWTAYYRCCNYRKDGCENRFSATVIIQDYLKTISNSSEPIDLAAVKQPQVKYTYPNKIHTCCIDANLSNGTEIHPNANGNIADGTASDASSPTSSTAMVLSTTCDTIYNAKSEMRQLTKEMASKDLDMSPLDIANHVFNTVSNKYKGNETMKHHRLIPFILIIITITFFSKT